MTYSLSPLRAAPDEGRAHQLPPCAERVAAQTEPWVGDPAQWCLELVLHDASGGELSFTALAAAPDGTLYAARPTLSQVVALTDDDGDGLPERMAVVADGLTLPNGLAYRDGALFISGGPNLHRYDPATGTLALLTDELPFGYTGYWTGGVTTDAVGNAYVGTGGDDCRTPGRGAVWRVTPNGAATVSASGLAHPADLAFDADGTLWAADAARDVLVPLAEGDDGGACGGTPPPGTLTINGEGVGMRPIGLWPYDGDAFPRLQGSLLTVMAGTGDEVTVRGFALWALPPGGPGVRLLPHTPPGLDVSWQKLNIQGSGFWPHHPYDVTANTDGWLYISVGGGFVYAVRPA